MVNMKVGYYINIYFLLVCYAPLKTLHGKIRNMVKVLVWLLASPGLKETGYWQHFM